MEKKYFAAANSKGGFVSWFERIFSPERLERLYIIKGGSGTGKSTLMRKIASEGEGRGLDCEYFYCSSDPDSLDGILLDGRIGVIDGTAPHTTDPRLPGACDEIINLGDFWDASILRENRDEIADLTRAKSSCFTQGYEYLYTLGELSSLLRSDIARAINSPKLAAAASRLLAQECAAARVGKSIASPEPEIRAISAISTKGLVTFDTYRELGRVIAVTDVMDTAPFMLDALLDAARRLGLEALRAPMPLEPELTEAIHFPALGLSVVISDGDEGYDTKKINMARFIDRGALTSDDRHRRKLLARCSRELMDGALTKLAEANENHARLEDIYRGAMDFDALDRFTRALTKRIIGEAVNKM